MNELFDKLLNSPVAIGAIIGGTITLLGSLLTTIINNCFFSRRDLIQWNKQKDLDNQREIQKNSLNIYQEIKDLLGSLSAIQKTHGEQAKIWITELNFYLDLLLLTYTINKTSEESLKEKYRKLQNHRRDLEEKLKTIIDSEQPKHPREALSFLKIMELQILVVELMSKDSRLKI